VTQTIADWPDSTAGRQSLPRRLTMTRIPESPIGQAGHPYAGVDEDSDDRVIAAGLEVLAPGDLQQSRNSASVRKGLASSATCGFSTRTIGSSLISPSVSSQ
jgi:hypothetical protein